MTRHNVIRSLCAVLFVLAACGPSLCVSLRAIHFGLGRPTKYQLARSVRD